MATTIPFTKTYTSPAHLVQLLKARGLSIHNNQKAEHYLQYIGYYRLSAYMYPLLNALKSQHQFKPKASFGKVMMLYRFDKKLRLLIFNEIEKIEVAVRSAIVNIGSKMTGNPFWMTDCANFTNQARFSKTLKLIEDEYSHSREDFILHFKETYSNPYPPSWILSEILPFGVMTNIYANIKDKKIKKRIAQSFGLQAIPFESWLTIVALIRNSCCHHARVWNKQNTIRPTMPNVVPLPWITLRSDPLRIYFNLCIIKYFLNTISSGNDMKEKVQTLLTSFSEVDVSAMGFPAGWEEEPLWK